MKLKLDEKGVVVLKNDKPVYIKDDGTELVFDAEQAFNKISELNAEAAGRRIKVKDLEEELNMVKQKHILGMTPEIKAQLEAERVEAQKQVSMMRQKAATAVLREAFARSPLVQQKLILPTDMVEAVFGKYFRVEDTETGFKIVAMGVDGKLIPSKINLGDPASFEEALQILVDARPDKAQIIKAGGPGSGSAGGTGGAAMPKPLQQMSVAEKAMLFKTVGAEAFANMLLAEKAAVGKTQPTGVPKV